MRAHAERRLNKVARSGLGPRAPGDRDLQGAQPARRRLSGGGGHAVSEGRDAARARRLAGDAALAEPGRRRARAPGQAPPRQTPPPPRGAVPRLGARAARGAAGATLPRSEQRPRRAIAWTRRVATSPAGSPRKLSLAHALTARSRAERRRGEEVQDLPEARRADRRVRGGARTRQRRRAARADGRAARARGRRRVARRAAAGVLCDRARDGQAHDGDAPLRRAADRRDGAARGPDRGDEDRRGQDADGDARGRAELAGRAGRDPPPDEDSQPSRPNARACTWSRSTTTWPGATRNG